MAVCRKDCQESTPEVILGFDAFYDLYKRFYFMEDCGIIFYIYKKEIVKKKERNRDGPE